MLLSIRAKEALGVTLLTLVVVAITTLINLSQLTDVTLNSVQQQTQYIQELILSQCRQSLSKSNGQDPQDILRSDQDLQKFLNTSLAYSPHLGYIAIADPEGKTILHTEEQKGGREHPNRPSLESLLSLGPIRKLLTLYKGKTIYESTLAMTLGDQPFGRVILGLHTSLLRDQLGSVLTKSLTFAGIALPLAWLITLGLATWTLRPIRALASQMERFRQGDFDVMTDLGRSDEFRELSSQLQLLGQQLKSDRLKVLNEQSDLRSMIDQFEDGLIFINQDHQIVSCNKAAELILGIAFDQICGSFFEEIVEDPHPLRQLLDETFENKISIQNRRVFVSANGTSKELLASTACMTEGPKVIGTIVFLKDIQSVDRFKSLVSYSAKLLTVGRLTSGMTHEIKNSLNAMAIHLELLKDELGGSTEEARSSAEIMSGEIRRLDSLVQGFLKFVRLQDLSLSPVNIYSLLQDEVAFLEAEWKKKDIHFSCDLNPHLQIITADEGLLRQVFRNILLNACQAMPEGGIVKLVTEKNGEDAIRVSITDQGVGIAPENQEKIFHLHYTTKQEGSGLGLAMSYRIVQLHEGVIEVDSKVGRGSTIIVKLPLKV